VDAVGYHYTAEDRRGGTADSSTNLPYTKLALGTPKAGYNLRCRIHRLMVATAANGDVMDWHRTTSTSATAGSTIIVPFDGTGIDIIGGNNGSAILDVSVDGAPLASNAASVSSGKRQATYTLRGLPDGSHTATFTLKSGTLVANAFNAISAEVNGPNDTTALQEALTAAGSPAQADYSAASWSVFKTTRSAARAALGVRPASTPWEPGSWHNG
jgi:hypothetical protein